MRASRLRSAARGLVLLMLLSRQVSAQSPRADTLPLPEHPRPDFQRAEWVNLNGRWRFAFDPRNEGEGAGWTRDSLPQGREIMVPFSWGAPLFRSHGARRSPASPTAPTSPGTPARSLSPRRGAD